MAVVSRLNTSALTAAGSRRPDSRLAGGVRKNSATSGRTMKSSNSAASTATAVWPMRAAAPEAPHADVRREAPGVDGGASGADDEGIMASPRRSRPPVLRAGVRRSAFGVRLGPRGQPERQTPNAERLE